MAHDPTFDVLSIVDACAVGHQQDPEGDAGGSSITQGGRARFTQSSLVAWLMLSKLKAEKLVIDWRKKARRKAGVRACIQDVLDALPDAYSDDLYDTKCGQVFEHVYGSYWGDGQSKYAVA